MDKELASALQQLMFEPFAFLSSNLGLYVENLYASHIVRTFIEIYSSVRVPDAVLKSRVKADFKPGEIFSCKIRAVSTWLCYCLWFFTARLYAGNLAALPCTCTYMYKWSLVLAYKRWWVLVHSDFTRTCGCWCHIWLLNWAYTRLVCCNAIEPVTL